MKELSAKDVNKIAFTGAIWYAASIDDTDK